MGIFSTCVTFTDSCETNKLPICAQEQRSHNVTSMYKCPMSKYTSAIVRSADSRPSPPPPPVLLYSSQGTTGSEPKVSPYFWADRSTRHTVRGMTRTQAASPRRSLVTATLLSCSHSMHMHTSFTSSRLVKNLPELAERPTLYVRCHGQGICFLSSANPLSVWLYKRLISSLPSENCNGQRHTHTQQSVL